jgi:hypothetical protein
MRCSGASAGHSGRWWSGRARPRQSAIAVSRAYRNLLVWMVSANVACWTLKAVM